MDIQWYEAGAISSAYRNVVPLKIYEYSRLIPAINRSLSSSNRQEFCVLAYQVHALGFKFRIHIMRGILRQAIYQTEYSDQRNFCDSKTEILSVCGIQTCMV